MTATKIVLDSKSPAVTFATLPDGTVIACEPDGGRLINWAAGEDDRAPTADEVTAALAFVRTQYQRANVARLNASMPASPSDGSDAWLRSVGRSIGDK